LVLEFHFQFLFYSDRWRDTLDDALTLIIAALVLIRKLVIVAERHLGLGVLVGAGALDDKLTRLPTFILVSPFSRSKELLSM
jgi:hypothetical protein